MKNAFFQLFALVILAGLMLHGCQKEPQSGDPAGQSHEMVYTPKAAKLVADINSFKQKMTAVREHPHLKSGEVLSKEDARWNLETLFNATYGFPDLTYRKTVTDTALLYLPVDASGNALLEDVVAVYDEILSLVTGFYIHANFDEKGFLFMQLSSGDVTNGELEIRLEAVTGARLGTQDDPPMNFGPFYEGDDWLYGHGWGKCDTIYDTIIDSDAAEQLQIAIHSNRKAWPMPPSGFRWMTVNPFDITLIGNEYMENGEYFIFYRENYNESDMCLDSTKMNFHFHGEEQVIYQKVPQYHTLFPEFESIEEWVFLNCEIKGYENAFENPPYIHHENKLEYAERYLIPISELPFPIELTDLKY